MCQNRVVQGKQQKLFVVFAFCRETPRTNPLLLVPTAASNCTSSVKEASLEHFLSSSAPLICRPLSESAMIHVVINAVQ